MNLFNKILIILLKKKLIIINIQVKVRFNILKILLGIMDMIKKHSKTLEVKINFNRKVNMYSKRNN
jgi:hypothetical protein